jgi:hypothetical protein
MAMPGQPGPVGRAHLKDRRKLKYSKQQWQCQQSEKQNRRKKAKEVVLNREVT